MYIYYTQMMRLPTNNEIRRIYLRVNGKLCTSCNFTKKNPLNKSGFDTRHHPSNIQSNATDTQEKIIPVTKSLIMKKIIGCPQNVKLRDYFFKLDDDVPFAPRYAHNIISRTSIFLFLSFVSIVIIDDDEWEIPEIALGVVLSPALGITLGLFYPILIPTFSTIFILRCISSQKSQHKKNYYRS